jgi:hypothetical protein
MHTQGFVTQDSPNTDGFIYFPPSSLFDGVTGLPATLQYSYTLGQYAQLPANTAEENFNGVAPLPLGIQRSGVYATPNTAQEQYGTGSALPGPVAPGDGTSDPLAQDGYPPFISSIFTAAAARTLNGPIAKGVQLNSLTVNYQVLTANLTAMSFALARRTLIPGVAPIISVIGSLTLAGTQLNVSAHPQSATVEVVQPAFGISPEQDYVLAWAGTKGATSVLNVYGMYAGVSFNYN